MIIRLYREEDLDEIAKLFYDTVHTINAKDYSLQQLDVWATGAIDKAAWNTSFLTHITAVATEDGKIIGFGDMDASGYLDRLYIHRDFQRIGIASALCRWLEARIQTELYITHASITAKPFFEAIGYRAIKEQQVERQGISLTNFLMEKRTSTHEEIYKESDHGCN